MPGFRALQTLDGLLHQMTCHLCDPHERGRLWSCAWCRNPWRNGHGLQFQYGSSNLWSLRGWAGPSSSSSSSPQQGPSSRDYSSQAVNTTRKKKKKNIREHLTMKTKDLHKPNEHKPGLCTLMETMNACLLTKRREKTTKIAEKGFMFLTEDLANGGSGFS